MQAEGNIEFRPRTIIPELIPNPSFPLPKSSLSPMNGWPTMFLCYQNHSPTEVWRILIWPPWHRLWLPGIGATLTLLRMKRAILLSQRFSYSPHSLSMYTKHGIGMNVPSGDNWILLKDHQPCQMGLPWAPWVYIHEKAKGIQEPSQSPASTWWLSRYVQYVVYQFSRRTSGVLLFLQGEPDTWYFCNDFIWAQWKSFSHLTTIYVIL